MYHSPGVENGALHVSTVQHNTNNLRFAQVFFLCPFHSTPLHSTPFHSHTLYISEHAKLSTFQWLAPASCAGWTWTAARPNSTRLQSQAQSPRISIRFRPVFHRRTIIIFKWVGFTLTFWTNCRSNGPCDFHPPKCKFPAEFLVEKPPIKVSPIFLFAP